MKKQYLKTVILAAALAGPLNAMGQVATPTHTSHCYVPFLFCDNIIGQT